MSENITSGAAGSPSPVCSPGVSGASGSTSEQANAIAADAISKNIFFMFVQYYYIPAESEPADCPERVFFGLVDFLLFKSIGTGSHVECICYLWP